MVGNIELLRQQLFAAMDEKVSAFETRLRERGSQQVVREEQEAERRVSDARERCSLELQDSLDSFTRERERLATSVTRLRERAAEDLERSLQAIKDAQTEALKETLRLQGAEVKSITAQLHEERCSLRAQIAEEKQRWRAQCQEKAAQLCVAEEERLVLRLRRQMKDEAAEVLRTLAAENERERRDTKSRLEAEAQGVRRELENLTSRNENLRVTERLFDLENEISGLRLELDRGNEDLKASAVTSSALKNEASTLLEAIGSAETALQVFIDEEEVIIRDPRVTTLSETLSKLRNEISSLRAEKNSVLVDFTESLKRLKSKQKVRVLFSLTDISLYS